MLNAIVFFAEVESGGQLGNIARTFGVDWSHLLAQVVSFCIMCTVLYRWAYAPVLKMLEERRKIIELGQKNAEQIKAELARTEAQRQEVIQKANVEANKIIQEAHVAAVRVEERETQKAIAEAEQITASSREAAAQDYERMLRELKSEVGRLVLRTTASVTGKVLTTEDQRRLVEATAKELHA
jgi:F-type H+-transporting ATPase subunit b